MAWTPETALTPTGWTIEADRTGGSVVSILSTAGQVVEISVDTDGVLSTTLSSGFTSPFFMRATDGRIYKLDTDAGLGLLTTVVDDATEDVPEWPIQAKTLSDSDGVAWDLTIDDNGVLETVLI